jgi:hypothetical protein
MACRAAPQMRRKPLVHYNFVENPGLSRNREQEPTSQLHIRINIADGIVPLAFHLHVPFRV